MAEWRHWSQRRNLNIGRLHIWIQVTQSLPAAKSWKGGRRSRVLGEWGGKGWRNQGVGELSTHMLAPPRNAESGVETKVATLVRYRGW